MTLTHTHRRDCDLKKLVERKKKAKVMSQREISEQLLSITEAAELEETLSQEPTQRITPTQVEEEEEGGGRGASPATVLESEESQTRILLSASESDGDYVSGTPQSDGMNTHTLPPEPRARLPFSFLLFITVFVCCLPRARALSKYISGRPKRARTRRTRPSS